MNILLYLIPIFSEISMIACWCLLKSFLTSHTVRDIIKGVFVVGSHTHQQLGLRNGSHRFLQSRLCFASEWLCGMLGLFMGSLWSGHPGILPTQRAEALNGRLQMNKEVLLAQKLWDRPSS